MLRRAMLRRVLPRTKVVPSDFPLFDDVKKGERYLLRETLFDVLDIFCVLDLYFVLCTCIIVFGHVFVWTCTCLCYLCFVVICHV